jgi:hypothetical protein
VATYIIVAVRKSDVRAPRHHEHIEAVKSNQGTVLTRAEVIAKIRARTDVFVTAGNPPGQVYVHNCPVCGTGDYITTHPDSTPTNNLLHLPTF